MHALLEGGAEGAVAVVAALLGQVEVQHGAHGSSCAVEQEIQYRQWSYLFGHILFMGRRVC